MIRGAGTYSRPLEWELEEADGPAPLVLLLHGLRQDSAFSLSTWSPLKGRVHMLAPNGPCVHERGRPRRIAHAWYVYDGNREELAREFGWISSALDGVVADVAARVEVTELWVAGFSQGAYLALYYGLCHNPAVTTVQACAGNLNVGLAFNDLGGRRVLLEHGNDDPACPVDRIEQLETLLVDRGADVERHLHECGHEVLPAMVDHLSRLVPE